MSAAANPILWTDADAVAATGGQCGTAFAAAGLSIDSRSLMAGDLFIALEGPNFDGHDYVADALNNGAAAALVHRVPTGLAVDAPLLVCGDTMVALRALGKAGRDRSAARIAAVTGSVGKTGTKEALKLVLSGQGRVSANVGSLNNHWGVPLSLARMAADAEFGVFEMGMNHPGEIAPLSAMARPHVAVITTVEPVHSAFFPSVEAIAEAKGEIFTGMEAGATAVLNRDNPQFEVLAAMAGDNDLRVLSFGTSGKADARLVAMRPDSEGSQVVAEIMGEAQEYQIGVPGRHWVMNSLAVLAAVEALGAVVPVAARTLASMTAPDGRGRRHAVHFAGGSFSVIDESYNASPVSMRAALQVLGQSLPASNGRRIAILGDMLELGDDAVAAHQDLADPLQENAVDLVFTAGPLMSHLWDAVPGAMRGGHAADTETLAPMVIAAIRPGDIVMVKGSAGSRCGVIVRALLAHQDDSNETQPKRAVNGD